MAKPAFIICAGRKSEDRETNALSLFDVVERVVLDAPPPAPSQVNAEIQASTVAANSSEFRASIVSVWLKEQADYGADFDAKFCLMSPSGRENAHDIASFTMKEEPTSFLHRVIVHLQGLPVLDESGVWMIEIRIRPVGGHWIKQGYPLVVDASEAYVAATSGMQSGLFRRPAN